MPTQCLEGRAQAEQEKQEEAQTRQKEQEEGQARRRRQGEAEEGYEGDQRDERK